MIAVDTNVLARYLLNDDAEQAKAAARMIPGEAHRTWLFSRPANAGG